MSDNCVHGYNECFDCGYKASPTIPNPDDMHARVSGWVKDSSDGEGKILTVVAISVALDAVDIATREARQEIADLKKRIASLERDLEDRS